MKLYLINESTCYYLKDIMKPIMVIYQMEREFYPYLEVDFLSNRYREKDENIIFYDGKEYHRKLINLKSNRGINELRNLILKYLPIIPEKTSSYHLYNTNYKYVQDLQPKLKIDESRNKSRNGPILRTEYTANLDPRMDLNVCRRIRQLECTNNFPHSSPLFRRCVDESEWLCTNAYPRNKRVEIIKNHYNNLKNKVFSHLRDNNANVTKQQVDTILSAGFFDEYGNKMGKYPENLFREGFEDNVVTKTNNLTLMHACYLIIILIVFFNF